MSNESALVLVVDDDRDGREMYTATLDAAGFRVEQAIDGFEAVDKAYKLHPELILMDLLMPRLDGYQMCVRLRNDPELRTVPIIVYTSSFGDAADKRFALSLGVDTFLIKPQDPQVLLEACRRVMGAEEEAEGDEEARRWAMPDLVIIDGGNSFYKDDVRRARELADRFFFETVVRVHRTEGMTDADVIAEAQRQLREQGVDADVTIENGKIQIHRRTP